MLSRWIGPVVILALVYGLLRFVAMRSTYYPMHYPLGLWDEQARIGATDVWLRAADGVRLHAWWIYRPEARFATLFLHGNAGNITHRGLRAWPATAAGSSLLLLDYRGYGRSEGSPSEAGLYADADAAYNHLLAAGYTPERIVVHGESLGSAVAVNLASRKRCAGLILEAPFTSVRAMAQKVFPVIGPLVAWGYDSRSRIRRVHCPLVVIHGDRDDIVPFQMGQELFAAAAEPKAFWEIRGAGHNDIVEAGGAEYAERLRQFYGSLP